MVHTFDDDASYAPRVVVPDECEANGEPQLLTFGRRPSCDGSIRDEEGVSNGKISPFANGYSSTQGDYRTDNIQLNAMRSNSSRTPTPHGIMEYTDSDIITTTSSQKSLERQPNNITGKHTSSPTVSLCSKETDL